jgi:CheY-like chemotaxis protein
MVSPLSTNVDTTAGVILYVEDEQPERSALALLLQVEGYAVKAVASGPEALAMAQGGLRPDILIVDFHLDSQMNGTEVAEQIRRVLGYTPPIIMMSGDLSNVEVPCISEVPVWLLSKPMNPRLLLAALPSLVQLSRATRGVLNQTGLR